MNPKQIALVRQTWEQIHPNSDAAGAMFYARLFELDPSLRPLFGADLQPQIRKLIRTIAMAVASLDRLESLAPALRELGSRHTGYGVKDGHYATVGAALLDTLAAGLAEAFTPEAREAWAETYALLAETMKNGAAQAGLSGSRSSAFRHQ